MKKVSLKIFSLLITSMIFVGTFVSCSNGSDNSSSSPESPSNGPVEHLSDSATITDVAAVPTSGLATVNGNTATLSASNGTYFLKQSQGTNSNISARNAAPEQSARGTWKFVEAETSKVKYAGSYTGSIASIGNSETSLTLKVEKIRNNDLLTAVVEEETINMTISDSGTFDTKIPAVKVSSINTYFHGNVHAWNDNGINLNACVERIDLCDGVITYFAVGSDKGKDNCDDNSIQSFKGTYTIKYNILEGTVNGKTRAFYIMENGGLSSDPNGEDGVLEPISGSYTVYANCVTKLDGNNSYAQERIVCFKEDSGKTGQVMEFKQIYQHDSTSDMKDITYEKNGNTVTLTGTGSSEGYSKTATISADGESLTLDGVVYLKL